MKTGSFWSWSLGVGLVALPLIGGCLRTVSPPAKTAAATEATVVETDPGITLSPPPDAASPQTKAEEAAVQPLPAEFALPPQVQPGKALTGLIHLAQAGADESVMLAFVNNSPTAFTPGADDLIYLKDIGVPGNVISAILQRDEQLKAGTAASAAAPAPVSAPGTVATAPVPYAAAPAAVPGAAVAPESAPPPAEYVTESAPPPQDEVIYPEFYDSLAPYGSWVDVDGYGYCWQPAVVGLNPVWQPYFDGGRWVYTDCGWYWMSDYTWGWAPFHYGRWFHHQHWGWCWQPDRVWAPAWVCWRHNDTHCGWAPLPPGVHFTAGIGLTGSLRPVNQLSAQHFRFVEWRYFRDHELAQHAVSRDQGSRIFGQTTTTARIVVLQGRVTNDGLSPERVAAATHTPVTRVALHDVQPSATASARPDRMDTSGRTLSVYRPQVAAVTVSRGTTPERVPMPKPLAVSSPGAARIPSAAPGSAPTAPIVPPPTLINQPGTVVPPAAPSHSYEAASRYYNRTAAPNRWLENSHTRLQSPKANGPEVPQYIPSTAERAPEGQVNPGAGMRVPPNPSPGAGRFNFPTADRPVREQPDSPRFNPPAVERPHRDAAPVERPSRVEQVESRGSHSAPAPAAPAPAPSHSSSSDRSDRSDRSDSGGGGSHGRR